MDEVLIADCHRAVLQASLVHWSPQGFELLMNPELSFLVEEFERSNFLFPGSFATMAGARRLRYTAAAGRAFSLFCLTHWHRLDWSTGAASAAPRH